MKSGYRGQQAYRRYHTPGILTNGDTRTVRFSAVVANATADTRTSAAGTVGEEVYHRSPSPPKQLVYHSGDKIWMMPVLYHPKSLCATRVIFAFLMET